MIMAKRQLNEQEKKFVNKSIERLQVELEYKENVELKRKEFNLEVAPLEYAKQVKDLEAELRALTSEVTELKNALTELSRQLEEGVDVREEK